MAAHIFKISAFMLISAMMVTGCNRSNQTKAETESPAPESKAVGLIPPRPDTPASALYSESGPPTLTERMVETVNSVAVRHPPNAFDELVIRATGIVTSAGWSNPRLVPVEDEAPNPTGKKFKFVATPPDDKQTGAGGPLHVQLRVGGFGPEVKNIEVASATNSVSVTITRSEPVQTAQVP